MAHLQAISDDVLIAGQIQASDFADLVDWDVRTIVINRPDDEEPGQLNQADIQALAKEHDINVVYNPVVGSQISDSDVAAQARAFKETTEGRVLSYCRSGMRSTVLWALANKHILSSDVIISRAAELGYDLRPLEYRLQGKI